MKKTLLVILTLLLCHTSFAFGTNGCNSNTVFLTHAEGVDASTAFIEAGCQGLGAKAIVANGNAQIDNAQFKFGETSALFDGSGDYLTSVDSADWDFGTGPFTIDFWFRPAVFTTGVAYTLIDRNARNEFSIRRGTDDTVAIWIEGLELNFGAWSPALNTWVHVAAVRDAATNVYFFVNGVQLSASQNDTSDVQGTTGIDIGRRADNIEFINGWMDEIRIVKGQAIWTTDFIPPASPYCNGCEMNGFFQ